jgi:hypothetical protein
MKTTGLLCAAFLLGVLCVAAPARELRVGVASVEITPVVPVALEGQFELRIARTVETPLTANVLVLESREGDRQLDAAAMVSCDLIGITPEILAGVRERLRTRLPELDGKKVFLNGTHTHTAPVLHSGVFVIPKDGVTQPEEYCRFVADRVAAAIVEAWNRRTPGSVTWGLSHAVVAYNRRAAYANGTAVMYGQTNAPEFRNLEGYEDHDVGTIFCWNQAGKMIGIVVNVSCTSQEVEGRTAVNADFWHPVRQLLRKRYGPEVCVLGWIGAAGDQSPHLMYRQAADERMRQLRGLDRLQEIARRIERAVDEAYEAVKNDRRADVPLVHKVETVRLPMRLVLESEYAEAKANCEQARAEIAKSPAATDQQFRRLKWHEETVKRFEKQKTEPKPVLETEVHVLRIGDAVVCTNQFELFTDYGIRIKARSKGVQTFVVQLVGPAGYLPTEKAVRGGGYSGIVQSGQVGPEGGQVLVERTVQLIDDAWK